MPHRPMAESVGIFFAKFFRTHGFKIDVDYPKDSRGQNMADSLILIAKSANRLLFYRPPTSFASFTDMMDAFSGGTSWTAHHLEIFENAVWKPTKDGYWFWVDTGWDKNMMKVESDLVPEQVQRLMCLEEYIIFYFSLQSAHPQMEVYPRTLGLFSWLHSKSHENYLLAKDGTRIEVESRQMGYLRFCEKIL